MEGTGNSSVFCVAEEGIIDPDINNSQLQLSPNELTALTEECEMQGSHSPLRNSILVAEVHSQNATAQSPEPGIPHSTPASEGSEFHTNQTADGPVGTSSASYNPATLSLTSLPTLVTEDVIIPSSSIFCDAPHGSSAGQVAQHSREDENVLKYFIILRPTGPAATVLAKVCMCLYCETQQSVKDYCFTNLGFNNNQYKRVFTAQERSALEANISWEVFDITFLYKLLQRVCGLAPPSDKRWAEPDPQYSDELEHCLYLIKGERNFLAHEAVTLSDSELRNRSHHMKTLLEKTSSFYGASGVRTLFPNDPCNSDKISDGRFSDVDGDVNNPDYQHVLQSLSYPPRSAAAQEELEEQEKLGGTDVVGASSSALRK